MIENLHRRKNYRNARNDLSNIPLPLSISLLRLSSSSIMRYFLSRSRKNSLVLANFPFCTFLLTMAESDCGREMLMILRMSCNNLYYSTNCILNHYARQLLRQINFGGPEETRTPYLVNVPIALMGQCGPGENRTPDPAMRMPCNATLQRAHQSYRGFSIYAYFKMF